MEAIRVRVGVTGRPVASRLERLLARRADQARRLRRLAVRVGLGLTLTMLLVALFGIPSALARKAELDPPADGTDAGVEAARAQAEGLLGQPGPVPPPGAAAPATRSPATDQHPATPGAGQPPGETPGGGGDPAATVPDLGQLWRPRPEEIRAEERAGDADRDDPDDQAGSAAQPVEHATLAEAAPQQVAAAAPVRDDWAQPAGQGLRSGGGWEQPPGAAAVEAPGMVADVRAWLDSIDPPDAAELDRRAKIDRVVASYMQGFREEAGTMMSDALDRLAGSPAVRAVDELRQAGVAYGQNVQHVVQGRWDQASLDAQDAGAHLLNATGAAVGGTFDPLGAGQAVVADPHLAMVDAARTVLPDKVVDTALAGDLPRAAGQLAPHATVKLAILALPFMRLGMAVERTAVEGVGEAVAARQALARPGLYGAAVPRPASAAPKMDNLVIFRGPAISAAQVGEGDAMLAQRPLWSLESVAGLRVRGVGLPERISLGQSPLDQRVLQMKLPVTLEDGQVVDVPVELLGTRSAQGVWELAPRSGELPEVLRQPVADAVRANPGAVYPFRGVALELRLGGAPQRVELPAEYRNLPDLDEFLVAAPRR